MLSKSWEQVESTSLDVSMYMPPDPERAADPE